MANSLKSHNKYARRAFGTFLGGLPALLALGGVLAVAPLALAQNPSDSVGEDYISDFFMGASEGMTPESNPAPATDAPPAAESVPLAPPEQAIAAPAFPPASLEPNPAPATGRAGGKPPLGSPPMQTASFTPKTGGKPPINNGGGSAAMPVAVLEPESSSSVPSSDAPPLANGERPLPVPPASGVGDAAGELGDDYFLGAEDLAENSLDSNSLTMPINLGNLPSVQWETTDPNAPTANFISDSPLPQFDSSDSHWKQLEIGQAEVVAPPPTRPGSVSTVNPAETAAPQGNGPATDRARLRSLFSDMLPPPGQGARPVGAAEPVQEQPPKTPETGSQALAAAPAETPTPQTPALVAAQEANGPPPPETPSLPAAESPEDVGASAILRAGGQLNTREHFGEAAILPPLESAPDLAAWVATQSDSPKAETPAPPKPAARNTGAKAPAGKGVAATAKPKPAAPVVRSPLTLVNETGNDRMLDVYRSVLSQMGYTIASVETRQPSAAPTGQTIIAYRPGARARARAVAAHLPGRKTLVEATDSLATEVAILLR